MGNLPVSILIELQASRNGNERFAKRVNIHFEHGALQEKKKGKKQKYVHRIPASTQKPKWPG